MVEAAPTPPLEVVEAQLLLELLVVALDPPAHLGGADQARRRRGRRQGRQPVLARLLLFLPATRSAAIPRRSSRHASRRCEPHPHACKARAQAARLPSRQLTVCQRSRAGRGRASLRPAGARPVALASLRPASWRRPAADIVEAERRRAPRRKPASVAIARVAQDDAGRHAGRARPMRSDRGRSPAWSGSRSPLAPPPCCGAPGRRPSLRQVKLDTRSAGSPNRWRPTTTRRPGSSPACPTGRNIGAPRRPSAGPSWESWCRR